MLRSWWFLFGSWVVVILCWWSGGWCRSRVVVIIYCWCGCWIVFIGVCGFLGFCWLLLGL